MSKKGAKMKETKPATDKMPQDCLFDKADSVRRSSMPGYARPTYKGVTYSPQFVTQDSPDGDKEKLTVLIETREGIWVRLWFTERDLEYGPTLQVKN